MSLIKNLIGRLPISQWMQPWLEFSSSPPSMADGDMANAQCSGQGSLKSAPEPTNAALDSMASRPVNCQTTQGSSAGTAPAARGHFLVVANFGGAVLMRVRCDNNNAALRYLQVHNTSAEPAASAVPVLAPRAMAAVAGSVPGFAEIVLPAGRQFATGITVVASTTQDTYTAAGADHWFEVEFYPAGTANG